ncbi:hypothetical protein EJ06DRAFT_585251 [Trichodelitschia bisporula]|uniref:Mis12-domain-containing protein n=1 Tax=Trichodelitschia bisporula TaxID=703511 RepID=A0A6G1HJX7_9PEZI|nr:hypothetical protein EJ06DRAFT_585251 [Trichodelitschia bisporula]
MSSTKHLETALLTEHLRYTPLTLLDDIINTINELTSRAIDAAESGLLSAPPGALGFTDYVPPSSAPTNPSSSTHPPPTAPPPTDPPTAARAEIENGAHQLETLLTANIDINFDKLEIYALRNVLAVPAGLAPWVRLPHYEGLQLDGQDGVSLDRVQELRRRVQEAKRLNAGLEAEARRNERVLERVRGLVSGGDNGGEGFGFLTQGTNTAFVLAQVPALRVLVDELRARVGVFRDAGEASEGLESRERRAYVEMQARRALERRGGVGPEGGRRGGEEEVRALEGVLENMEEGE